MLYLELYLQQRRRARVLVRYVTTQAARVSCRGGVGEILPLPSARFPATRHAGAQFDIQFVFYVRVFQASQFIMTPPTTTARAVSVTLAFCFFFLLHHSARN